MENGGETEHIVLNLLPPMFITTVRESIKSTEKGSSDTTAGDEVVRRIIK